MLSQQHARYSCMLLGDGVTAECNKRGMIYWITFTDAARMSCESERHAE